MPLLAMGPDGQIMGGVNPNDAELYGGSAVWQNDDGTIWRQPDGGNDGTADFIRPDLRAAWAKDSQDKASALYRANPQAFSQLTPEQFAKIKELSFGHPASELNAYMDSIRPNMAANINGSGLYGNGSDAWWGPAPGPQHTDSRSPFSAESLILPGQEIGGETGQSFWNTNRTGLGVMALPLLGAGITAGLGAGTVAGGAAVGGTETGITAGATGSGALSGSTGSASLVGEAGADTLGGTVGETGAFDQGASQGVFDSAGNPIATSSDGGAFDMGGSQGVFDSQGNPTYSSPTTLASLAEQAKQMAAQFGITPASALGLLKSGLLKGAPAVLGAVGANQQRQSLEALTKQYMDLGAPSRARYEASFAPGFTMANDPGYQDALDASSKATLHSLSVQGNPAGSPDAWSQSLADNYAKTAYPALQNFRNTNANAGGIASLQTAAPAAATGAITAQGNVFNAIGAGANDIFNPQPSLAQTLAQYQQLIKQQGSGAVQ